MRQDDEHADLASQLVQLRQEHRDLDVVIAQLVAAAGNDQLRLTRMKKRKLALKDAIARLESRLIPDLNA